MIGDKMCLSPDVVLWHSNVLTPMLYRLSGLYAAMDRQYEEATRHYGFQCDGCRENCCQTRFYHHTIIEYFYLMKGVDQLSPETREAVLFSAAKVVNETRMADQSGQKLRLMCPLNREQLCMVYPFRPMICRLHGISHELHRNGGTILRGEGCQQFDDQTYGKSYFRYDRTPFYGQMALLEKDVRRAIGFTRKLKMTIAEMLTAEGLVAHYVE
jgi:Fe-S-cluster containining protein